jgi:hypothetical protein
MHLNTNSVIFDFYSLVDIELTLINYIRKEYIDSALISFDKTKLLTTKDEDWKFARTHDKEDVISSILVDENIKRQSFDIVRSIYARDMEIILPKYAFPTDIDILVKAFRQVDDGNSISVAIQCENVFERKYIESKYPGVDIMYGPRDNLDISGFGKLFVGHYSHALEYNIHKPTNISILDFRENFTDDDMTILRPEFIVRFGDINDISIANAYKINKDRKEVK